MVRRLGARIADWARAARRDVVALSLAARDRRVPWYAKALAAAVVAYAISPIDLIPDFVPVLGHLDDLVLVPLGILCVVALIPAAVMADLRDQAALRLTERRPSRAVAAVVITIWLAGMALAGRWLHSVLA